MTSIYDILDNLFNGVDPKVPVGEYRTNNSPGSGLMEAINWAASKRDGVIDSMNRNTYGSVPQEEWDSMMRKEEEPFIGPSQFSRSPLSGMSDAFREIFKAIDENSYSGRQAKRIKELAPNQKSQESQVEQSERKPIPSDPVKVIRKLQEGIDGNANTFIARGDDIFSSYDKRDIVDSKNKAGQPGFSRLNKPEVKNSFDFSNLEETTGLPPLVAKNLQKALTNPDAHPAERAEAAKMLYEISEKKKAEQERANLLQSPFGPYIEAINNLLADKNEKNRELGMRLRLYSLTETDPDKIKAVFDEQLGVEGYKKLSLKKLKQKE